MSEISKLGGPSKIWFRGALGSHSSIALTVVVSLADDMLLRMVILVLPLRMPHPGRNLP